MNKIEMRRKFLGGIQIPNIKVERIEEREIIDMVASSKVVLFLTWNRNVQ